MNLETKFRAFQLGCEGSLFSFYKGSDNVYTLIEARIPKDGIKVLQDDLAFHGKTRLDSLHITSWDKDHCNYDDLVQIMNHLRPTNIDVPGYEPTTDTGKLCKALIKGYDNIHQPDRPNIRVVDRNYLLQLTTAAPLGLNDVAYHSKYDTENCNDKSLIRLFRSNGFNVLSLGDMECKDHAAELIKCSFVQKEVDVLMLPHHGAHNGYVTPDFLKAIKPRIAICTSNWGNQYGHPKPEVQQMLRDAGVPLFTTKAGDVVILQREGQVQFEIHDFKTNNDYKSPVQTKMSKRHNNVFDPLEILLGNY